MQRAVYMFSMSTVGFVVECSNAVLYYYRSDH